MFQLPVLIAGIRHIKIAARGNTRKFCAFYCLTSVACSTTVTRVALVTDMARHSGGHGIGLTVSDHPLLQRLPGLRIVLERLQAFDKLGPVQTTGLAHLTSTYAHLSAQSDIGGVVIEQQEVRKLQVGLLHQVTEMIHFSLRKYLWQEKPVPHFKSRQDILYNGFISGSRAYGHDDAVVDAKLQNLADLWKQGQESGGVRLFIRAKQGVC